MMKSKQFLIRVAILAALGGVATNAAVVNVAPAGTFTYIATSGSGGVRDGTPWGLQAGKLFDGDTGTSGLVDGGMWNNDARGTVTYDQVYLNLTYSTAQTIGGFGVAGLFNNIYASLEYSTDGGTTWNVSASQFAQANSSYNSDGTSAKFPAMTAKNWRLVAEAVNGSGDTFSPVRSRVRAQEIALWNYTGADAASLPVSKQVNVNMYVMSVDIAGDGIGGYNNYPQLVKGAPSALYVNRDGQPAVVSTYVFDQPRAISGFGLDFGHDGNSILLEYSTDLASTWHTVAGIPSTIAASFNTDGTDPLWKFAPVTAQSWRYTITKPLNNLYLQQTYFFTTVEIPEPASVTLLSIGAMGLLARPRRKD